MPLIPLLLRLLLCIVLVANGVSSAKAGVRMAFVSGSDVAAAQQPDPGVSPCHDQAAESIPMAEAASSPATGDTSDSHCCEQGLCECLCTPASPQFAHVLRVAAANADGSGIAGAPTGTRTSPRLPHLIRPPIG